jgi:HSP20 family molecular chaperone IbpA
MNFVNKDKMQEKSKQYHQDIKMILHHKEVITLFEELIHEPWGYERWRPAIDISEYNDFFAIKADLPGVSIQNIKISASGTKLLIEGIRHFDERNENMKLHICERPRGKFVREIGFLEEISSSHIETSFENGVLTVIVKKKKLLSV